MLLYSHIWDGVLKVISLAALIIAAASWKLAERIQSLGIVAQSGSVLVMIVVMGLIWLALYRQVLSILSSWMYARMTLRASVTFTEAKALRKLFQLDLSGKWIPLREIKNLPDDQRHDALLTALGRLGAGARRCSCELAAAEFIHHGIASSTNIGTISCCDPVWPKIAK